MDFEFIFGIILSILLSVWGIWHANKSKKKSNLTLVDREWISIIDTYDDKEKILERINYTIPFNTNQYYYRGTIINSGNTDIYKSIILKPLKISFPENFKLLNFNIVSNNTKIEINYTQNADSVIIEWDILKPLEYFSFEMIFESSKSHSSYELNDRFILDYRIADLRGIDRVSYSDLRKIKRKNILGEALPNYLGFSFGLLMFGVMFSNGIKSFSKESGKIETLVSSKISKEPVTFEYFNRDSLNVRGNKSQQIVAIKDLNKNVEITVKKEITKDLYVETIIASVFLIALLFGIYNTAKTQIEDYKLKKVMKSLDS